MSTDLERELHSLFEQRAATITVDVAAGEEAIGQRLAAGDVVLADALAAPSRSRRLVLAAAAAVIAIVAIGTAVALTRDDPTVDTGPAGPPSTTASTTTTTTPPSDDPTLGEPGESAKDVAERVAAIVFGTEFVTIDARSGGDRSVTLVTMEGEGGTVVAEVTFDPEVQRQRLSWITSPELDEGGTFGTLTPDGQLQLELPAAGRLRLTALGEGLVVTRSVTTDVPAAGPFTLDGGDQYVDVPFVVLTLETSDGRVLRALGRP